MTEILVHISAGQGPDECRWVVARLAEAFVREAAALHVACEPIEPLSGPCASALLRIEGEDCDRFVDARQGTIRWVGTSPFRPHHRRRNWFVAVTPVSEAEPVPEFRDEDIRYEAIRASGPGGQHVNKTDSAVRAIHLPTRLSAFAQDQRSQFANRKIARLRLAMLFDAQRRRGIDDGKRAMWHQNQALERGNAVLTYEGPDFRLRR